METVLPWKQCYHGISFTMETALPWKQCYHGNSVTMETVLPWKQCYHGNSVTIETLPTRALSLFRICPLFNTHSIAFLFVVKLRGRLFKTPCKYFYVRILTDQRIYTQTHRHRHRHTDRHTDRQTDTHTDTHRHRQTQTHTQTYSISKLQ